MPKRKAIASDQVADEVVTKSKSVSKRVKSGDVGAGVFSIPPGFKTIWQLEEETKQSWHSYHQDIQDALSSAVDAGKMNVKLSAGPRTALSVDVSSLLQMNNKGFAKRVRCLVESADTGETVSWEVKEGDNWFPLSVAVCVKLEQVRDIGSRVTVDGVVFDLEKMTRVSDGSEIRREKQILKKITKSSITFNIKLAKDQDEDEGAKSKSGKSKSAVKDDPEEESKPVMKSVIKKGLAPVDSECPGAEGYHVFCEGTEVWDVMLNQTNIQNNNNKYFLIQLLQSDNNSGFSVWMRWGRVGYKGQNNLKSYGSNKIQAMTDFKKKFSDKTKNDWEDRDSFVKVAGKYDLVKIDYNNTKPVDEGEASSDVVDAKEVEKVESKLPNSVQELIKLICDIKTMEEAVIEMKYDTKKAPLGKITVEQIKAGYSALKKISECVENGKTSGSEIVQACNDFYTRIPHEFGFKTPPIIRSPQEVKRKLELLETLSDIQVALKILSTPQDTSINPVDRKYNQLKVDIQPMEKKSKEFKLVEQSIKTTHASTHNQYKMEVMDMFSLDKSGEAEKFKECGNSKLLFHGSRLSNWAGILGNGLKIAPPEAPVTGYMFGKGVYFADMSSKSANYCYPSRSQPVGLLLMCEVALGETNNLVNADYNASTLPPGKNSVMGLGRVEPSSFKSLDSGLQVPMGPAKNDSKKQGNTLNYNEFIVYDTKQIKMKYLAKIKFDFKY